MSWLYKRLHHSGRRAERRAWGIMAWVGANGGGKSAGMVWDAIPDLEAGRPVLSTVRIHDYENLRDCDDPVCLENPDRLDHFIRVPTPEGRATQIRNAKAMFFMGDSAPLEEVETVVTGVHRAAHPLWIPWKSWPQLLEFKGGRVLADEMTGIASSRESMTLPPQVVNHLQQLRRGDAPFSYTCPDWARADKSLREPTQAVTVCTGSFKTSAPMMGDQERVWKAKRLFKWQTYDARTLDSITEGKRTDLGAETTDLHWGPNSPAFLAYDTFAPVLQVGTVSEAGRCFRCGGNRPAPKCQCDGAAAPRSRSARQAALTPVEPGHGRRVLQLADSTATLG